MRFWIWFTVVRPAHCWQFLLLRESRKVNLTLSSVFLAQMPICMGANTWWWTVAKRIPSWALLYHICREYEFLALGWLIAGLIEQAPAFHISAATQMSCALLKDLPNSVSGLHEPDVFQMKLWCKMSSRKSCSEVCPADNGHHHGTTEGRQELL